MSDTELRAHTAFSFNDGAVTPEALVQKAAELGHHTIGIPTPRIWAARAVRSRVPAPGNRSRSSASSSMSMDGPLRSMRRTRRDAATSARSSRAPASGHLSGWVKGQSADKRGRPRVSSVSDVAERSAGVIALTGPASGPIGAKIQACEYSAASRMLSEWRDVFGDRLAVEVQLHHAGGCESALASALIDLAKKHGCPMGRAE